MLNNMSRYSRMLAILIPTLAIVLVVSVVLSVTARPAAAQGVNVQFTELDCDSDPEVIVVSNQGTQPVEMTGWNLQSDPTAEESLPLASLGSLLPGQSIMVEAGPASEAAFTWSRDFVFRNNDPTDFAQLANDAGDVLIKVNCGSVGQATATAAPTSAAATTAATPTPTPAVLGSSAVPTGGGSPVAGVPLLPPAALIAAGSALLASGLAAVAIPLPWRRRRIQEVPVELASPTEPLALPAGPQALPAPSRPATSSDVLRPYLFLAVIILAVIAMLAFLAQLGEHKRE